MPALKPCLKSGGYNNNNNNSGTYPSSNRPPIPIHQHQDAIALPRSSSFIDNTSALPYAQPFVHFPPSPILTSTYVVDPPRLYDRTPIVVSNNECALPSRGCRTYTATEHHNSKYPRMDGFFLTTPPPLIPDEGSSEESDGLVSPPPEYSSSYSRSSSAAYCHSSCTSEYHSSLCHAAFAAAAVDHHQSAASMFLPHPHSRTTSAKHPPSPSGRSSRTRTSASFGSSWDSPCLGGF